MWNGVALEDAVKSYIQNGALDFTECNAFGLVQNLVSVGFKEV